MRDHERAGSDADADSLIASAKWRTATPIADVASRMPGHWEGDFIKGGNKSSVGVLVECSTHLMLLARMEDAIAGSALAGFTVKLNPIAAPMRQSFTCDQGSGDVPAPATA